MQPIKATLVRVGRTYLNIFSIKIHNVWIFVGCTGKIGAPGAVDVRSSRLELWETPPVFESLGGPTFSLGDADANELVFRRPTSYDEAVRA